MELKKIVHSKWVWLLIVVAWLFSAKYPASIDAGLLLVTLAMLLLLVLDWLWSRIPKPAARPVKDQKRKHF